VVPVRVVLDVNGERREYPAADLAPELLRAPTAAERRLLRFRNIVQPRAGQCAH